MRHNLFTIENEGKVRVKVHNRTVNIAVFEVDGLSIVIDHTSGIDNNPDKLFIGDGMTIFPKLSRIGGVHRLWDLLNKVSIEGNLKLTED